MQEIWKDVDGYVGFYKISNFGRLKSLYKKEEIIIKPHIYKNGYCRVRLWDREKRKFKDAYIHRLVANAFLENPQNLPEVNHKDENKENNCVDNLEWCTSKYNANYGTRNKRMIKQKCSKAVIMLDLSGNELKRFESLGDASRETGFDISAIIRVCKGRQKTSMGYKWKYAD